MPDSSPQPFSGIFVSYRRDDSSGHAGRLFDKLVSHFGKERIFMDIDTIEPGEDFVTVIENAVGSCEILIAIIGRQWLSSAGRNTGRLDNPHDFVRLEIATALARNIRVIPVLVQRASMPKPQDLPDDLAKFSRRNAVELTDLRWQTDVDQLISFLESVLAKREAAKLAEEERRRQENEEKLRLENEQQTRLQEAEAAQRAAEEARRREQEEREQREAEERAKQAEVAARVAEAEGLRQEEQRREEEGQLRLAEEAAAQRAAEEQRRLEEDKQLRLAEEAATQRAAEEQRRLQENKERRQAEERARLESQEASRRRAEEDAQALKRAAEQPLQLSREEEQTQPEVSIPVTVREASPSESAMLAGTPPFRENGTTRKTLFVGIACVALLAVAAGGIWIWQSSARNQQSASNTPGNLQAQQTASVPSTTVPQETLSPTPEAMPTLNKASSEKSLTNNNRVFSSKEVSTKARILSKPEPVYTESAKKNQVTGTVVLRALFTSDGTVSNITTRAGLPYGLTESAIAAAKQIRFVPATKDGRPVSMYIQLEYNFDLY